MKNIGNILKVGYLILLLLAMETKMAAHHLESSIYNHMAWPEGDEGDEEDEKKKEQTESQVAQTENEEAHWLVMNSKAVRPELATAFYEWEFHPFLIPASDIYCDDWDSLSVDNLDFNPLYFSGEIPICLTEGDCDYQHPFMGRITSNFGWRHGRMHKGIDIDLETGDSVVAAFDGVVRIQKNDPGGFGNYVLIRHYNGLETIYAHLSEAWVERNEFVRAGEIIGLGGNTGRSTGSHLHFETRYLGQPIDPTHVINFSSGELKSDTLIITKEHFKPAASSYTARYHKIRKGDTLSGLARRYGTSVTAICRMNGISRNSVLRIGKVLRVR